MRLTHDVFSETNPAFGVYALVGFTTTFSSVNEDGPEIPAVYLALPLALSADLDNTFQGTNKNTGLLEWLERSPDVQVGLAKRINWSMDIVSRTINLGCFTQTVKVGNGARLLLGDRKVNKSAANRLSNTPSRSLKRAERLGYWFANAGSTKTLFDMMGLTV